jgi:hypothetical protein
MAGFLPTGGKSRLFSCEPDTLNIVSGHDPRLLPSAILLMENVSAGFHREADDAVLDTFEKAVIRNVIVRKLGIGALKPVYAYVSVSMNHPRR